MPCLQVWPAPAKARRWHDPWGPVRGSEDRPGGVDPDLSSRYLAPAGASIESVARRKLRQLELAACLADLAVPPGNRLEALRGDREGQHSIRVNDPFRVCFRWGPAGVEDVEIVDYH